MVKLLDPEFSDRKRKKSLDWNLQATKRDNENVIKRTNVGF